MTASSVREIWDPDDEPTNPGDLGGLGDRDSFVMLGKVAGRTAKNTRALGKLVERFEELEAFIKSHAAATEAALKSDARKTRRLVLIVVVAIEAIVRAEPLAKVLGAAFK